MRLPVKVNIIIPVPKAIKGTSTGGMTDTKGIRSVTTNKGINILVRQKAVLRYSLIWRATTKPIEKNKIDERKSEIRG